LRVDQAALQQKPEPELGFVRFFLHDSHLGDEFLA